MLYYVYCLLSIPANRRNVFPDSAQPASGKRLVTTGRYDDHHVYDDVRYEVHRAPTKTLLSSRDLAGNGR